MINQVLPDDVKDYVRVLDKKGVKELLKIVAEKHPDKYLDIAKRLMDVGLIAAHTTGATVSLSALTAPPAKKLLAIQAKHKVFEILDDNNLTDEQKEDKIREYLIKLQPRMQALVVKQGLAEDNPFNEQASTGSRGNESNLLSLRAGDIAIADHKNRIIPIPIFSSYADGLSPAEYWAASYGSRQGTILSKFATRDAGDVGKQLVRAAHRLVVSQKDCGTKGGIVVDSEDDDSVGSILAADVTGIPAGTEITTSMLNKIKSKGNKEILVRSPITCEAGEGLCQKCVGRRERIGLPDIRDNVGIAAAQAIAEKLSQAQLSARHSGGQVGASAGGISAFSQLDQLWQVPKFFKNVAAISPADGLVRDIEKVEALGTKIIVGDKEVWAPPGMDVLVKAGQKVEAGDVLSDGMPNAKEIARHKGVGEGRKVLMQALNKVVKDNNMGLSRRNIELLSRALVNHVQITDLNGYRGHMYGDIVPYDMISKGRTRPGTKIIPPDKAAGRYLERPVLDYSIGTRITPSVVKRMKQYNIKAIDAHKDIPAFEPHMLQARFNIMKDPDWMTRLSGIQLGKTLLEGVHRGDVSEAHSTSYVPALSKATDFAKGDKPYEY